MKSSSFVLVVVLTAVLSPLVYSGDEARLVLSAKDSWVEGGGAVKAGRWIKGWSRTSAKIRWDVEFAKAGVVDVILKLAAPGGLAGAGVQVSIGEQKIDFTTKRTESWRDFAPMKVGSLEIPGKGRQVVTVQALTKKGVYVGDLESVVLVGGAAEGARVIPKVTRADSVHLWWKTRERKVTQFYNEIIVKDSYPATYFMACGFHRGYFGIQEVNRSKKMAIFSVWDPRSKSQNPNKVKPEDRVVLLAKGDGVRTTRFGNEGTGGKSTFEYEWHDDQVYRFLVEAERLENATVFTGWIYLNEKKEWHRMASFKVTGHSEYLRGLYSFVEDWRGHAAHKYPRRALFGNAWVRNADGDWSEVTRVRFTQAGKLKNVNCRVVDKRFMLATGADVEDTTGGERSFRCEPHGEPPAIELPK